MPAGKKEPMISQTDRPTAIDYDAPITNFKVRDLMAIVHSQFREYLKPEYFKPEYFKEYFKPEKEIIKPEKELDKPEKQVQIPDPEMERLVESIAVRVVEILKKQGIGK